MWPCFGATELDFGGLLGGLFVCLQTGLPVFGIQPGQVGDGPCRIPEISFGRRTASAIVSRCKTVVCAVCYSVQVFITLFKRLST